MASNLRGWPSFPDVLPEFRAREAPSDPHTLFLDWVADAGEHCFAPHAGTLSTVDTEGAPDARVVILRDVDTDGWYVATSAQSPKGAQLSADPRAALTFFWPRRGRQIRLRGQVEPTTPTESAADFQNRSLASRVEAFVDHQSEPLDDVSQLDEAAAVAEQRLAADPALVPDSWTRYLLTADTVEFWQASPDRKHVRLHYRRQGSGWLRERLWP